MMNIGSCMRNAWYSYIVVSRSRRKLISSEGETGPLFQPRYYQLKEPGQETSSRNFFLLSWTYKIGEQLLYWSNTKANIYTVQQGGSIYSK